MAGFEARDLSAGAFKTSYQTPGFRMFAVVNRSCRALAEETRRGFRDERPDVKLGGAFLSGVLHQ